MADRPASLFVLAGEASGDRIGAALLEGLRARMPVEVSGVGGAGMAAEGLRSLFPMADLSVMGFADVARRLPLLYWRMFEAARAVRRLQPDAVVLIDSQVFSATLAKRLRRIGYRGPILLYVAPAVWAWKPERAPGLKESFSEILGVLPFEPAALARLGGPPTSYVGHPAVSRFAFRPQVPERGPMLLLPGSRDGEISRTLGMMREAAASLLHHPRITGFVLPTPASREASMRAAVAGWNPPVEVIADEAEKHAAFAAAVAALAVSGTVTLELALSGVPTIATYVGDRGQAKRFARYKVRFVSLPNIILDRPLIPELLFVEPDAARLAASARQLLDVPEVAAKQLAGFAELRRLMQEGAPEAPLVDPVDRVAEVLARSRAAGLSAR